jgi:hypothetical protein
MLLRVSYSSFTFDISVLNVEGISHTHFIPDCFKGSFSAIYRAWSKGSSVAIKSNKIDETNFSNIFTNTLQEYIVFKIIEQFEAGPAMKNYLGFDLLIYDDTIEFSMEFCSHELTLDERI